MKSIDEVADISTRTREISFTPAPFEPAWWLRGAHVQTIGGRWLRPVDGPPYHRRRIATPDGDFLALDIPRIPLRRPPRGAVLLLHGLEGCSRSRYVLETCRRLARHGLQAIALNFRSCGGEPNRTRRFYHSGATGDLEVVVRWMRDRWPDLPLGAIGFSLGGNMLLKYLGELGKEGEDHGEGDPDGLRAAVAVSVPFDLAASARKLESDLTGRMYAGFFLRSLRRSIRAKVARYAHEYDLEGLEAARTLRDFDDAITAPVHGFENAEDYYRRCSSERFLPGIRVPTLLLQAEDDPFLPDGCLPLRAVTENPWLYPAFTARGGHLGFVEGDHPGRVSFWAERQASRFMAAALRS